jgi:hypothetical protein
MPRVDVPTRTRRQLTLLKSGLDLAAPADPAAAGELSKLAAKMEGDYGRAHWCPDASNPASCLDVEAITDLLAREQDPEQLRKAWEGWHASAVPMRSDYARFVTLANQGARELGFADTGARRGLLRSGREVSRRGRHFLHPLFPCGNPAVPVPSRAVRGCRLSSAAVALLDLRKYGGGPTPGRDACAGPFAAVA